MIDFDRVFRGWKLPPEFRVDPREHRGLIPWALVNYGRIVRHLPSDDVRQMAWEALLRCCVSCDNPETFGAYALSSIRGTFINAARRQRRITSPGFGNHGLVYKFVRREHLAGTLTLGRLRAEFGFLAARGDDDLARVIDWCLGADQSTEALVYDDGARTVIESVPDPQAPDPVAVLESRAWLAVLDDVGPTLGGRDRDIFDRRVLDDPDEEGNELRAIGEAHGVTKQRIQQLEAKVHAKLRDAMAARGLDGPGVLRPSQREHLAEGRGRRRAA